MPDNAHPGSISSDDSLYFANSAAASGGSDTNDLFGSAEDPSSKNGTVNIPQFAHDRNPPKIRGGVRSGVAGPTGAFNLTPGFRNIP